MLQLKNLRVEQCENILKQNNITLPPSDNVKIGKNSKKINGYARGSPETMDNLMNDEHLESINEMEEMRQICEDQKNEIIRLGRTVNEQQDISENKNEELGSLQNEYQEKMNAISSKYQGENNILQDH